VSSFCIHHAFLEISMMNFIHRFDEPWWEVKRHGLVYDSGCDHELYMDSPSSSCHKVHSPPREEISQSINKRLQLHFFKLINGQRYTKVVDREILHAAREQNVHRSNIIISTLNRHHTTFLNIGLEPCNIFEEVENS
jgi:hypothetical protein